MTAQIQNRSMNKRIIFLVMTGIFLISIVSAAEISYCCEKTKSEVWCQNAPIEQCNDEYLSAPTSCEATSYCRLGVCINTEEGDCMPNTPETVCTENQGEWDMRKKSEIPQCQLGCCLVGDQAAFVTLTRCRSLSSKYGLEVDYRADITSEVECIASSSKEKKGACVYEKEVERTCEMLTKEECQQRDASFETEFYEGYLCSAESLGTVCAPRGGTTCVEGKEEVYFLDTCGNVANVYDIAAEKDDPDYWTYIKNPTCTVNSANRKTCGNCDYYLGSTCKKPEKGGSPNYGSYICEDLSCTYNGETYKHGETWCADSEGISTITSLSGETTSTGTDLVGGSYTRLLCYNGEVTAEPCAEFRQEICIESFIPTNEGNFKTAACRANKWQDCVAQTTEDECENEDARACKWDSDLGRCAPLYNPGFNFWEEGDAASICGLATIQCKVLYSLGIAEMFGWTGAKGGAYDFDCVTKCKAEHCILGVCNFLNPAESCLTLCPSECVEATTHAVNSNWEKKINKICTSLGDCGVKKNYIGRDGYYTKLDKLVTRSNEIAV